MSTPHLTPLELFQQADVIVKTIIVLLAAASLASWGVIADKLLRFAALRRNAAAWTRLVAGQRALGRLAEALGRQPHDPFARVYHAIADEWHASHQHGLHTSAAGRDGVKERVNRVGQIASNGEIEGLQKGLQVLATIGSVAPFVGLFGTVWGIMNAFQGIAASNNTSLAVVAPGIAEALFATALGLVAAIPATVAFNRISSDLNHYAGRLATLVGLVEVQLSRQLETGEPLPDLPDTAHVHAARTEAALAAQGA